MLVRREERQNSKSLASSKGRTCWRRNLERAPGGEPGARCTEISTFKERRETATQFAHEPCELRANRATQDKRLPGLEQSTRVRRPTARSNASEDQGRQPRSPNTTALGAEPD